MSPGGPGVKRREDGCARPTRQQEATKSHAHRKRISASRGVGGCMVSRRRTTSRRRTGPGEGTPSLKLWAQPCGKRREVVRRWIPSSERRAWVRRGEILRIWNTEGKGAVPAYLHKRQRRASCVRRLTQVAVRWPWRLPHAATLSRSVYDRRWRQQRSSATCLLHERTPRRTRPSRSWAGSCRSRRPYSPPSLFSIPSPSSPHLLHFALLVAARTCLPNSNSTLYRAYRYHAAPCRAARKSPMPTPTSTSIPLASSTSHWQSSSAAVSPAPTPRAEIVLAPSRAGVAKQRGESEGQGRRRAVRPREARSGGRCDEAMRGGGSVIAVRHADKSERDGTESIEQEGKEGPRRTHKQGGISSSSRIADPGASLSSNAHGQRVDLYPARVRHAGLTLKPTRQGREDHLKARPRCQRQRSKSTARKLARPLCATMSRGVGAIVTAPEADLLAGLGGCRTGFEDTTAARSGSPIEGYRRDEREKETDCGTRQEDVEEEHGEDRVAHRLLVHIPFPCVGRVFVGWLCDGTIFEAEWESAHGALLEVATPLGKRGIIEAAYLRASHKIPSPFRYSRGRAPRGAGQYMSPESSTRRVSTRRTLTSLERVTSRLGQWVVRGL
ncbi:hypothetical protein K438DRAFT_1945283 [Mycena galopus ATCC 62051]|nr:hypothetical protein K438DRAFT_1945283 [Mycena galopus ATCC 62051]